MKIKKELTLESTQTQALAPFQSFEIVHVAFTSTVAEDFTISFDIIEVPPIYLTFAQTNILWKSTSYSWYNIY